MSFTLNSRVLVENLYNTRNYPTYYPVEESFFRASLEFIQEQQNEIRMQTVSFYESSMIPLSEAGMQEKFNDFSEKVKTAIDKILKFFSEMINKFIGVITKNLSITNQTLKLKDKVLKYCNENNLKYNIDGYLNQLNEKMTDPNIPSSELVVNFLKMQDNVPLYIADAFNAYKTKNEKKIKEMDEFIKKSEEMADAARGAFIGTDAQISSDGYLKFLRDEFLGSRGDVNVDYNYIAVAFDNIADHKNLSTQLKSSFNKIKKEYLSIESVFKLMYPGMRYKEDLHSVNVSAHIKTLKFSNRIWNVVHRRMQDHLLTFSTKLDCLNKIYKQDMSQILKVAAKAKFIKSEAVHESDSTLTDILEDFSYDMFLMENHIGNIEVKDYLVRNVLKEDSADIIYEASIQEAINAIVQKIANIFANYSHRVNSFFKIDKEFFDKNKDVILKNKFKSFTLKDLYTYNVDKMKEAECPPLDITSMDKDLESKDTFIKAEFGFYAANQKDDANFFDTVKSTLRGALREEVDASTLDPTQLLRFCQDFDNSIFNTIRRDIKTLQTSNNNISTYIKQLNKDNSKADIQNDSYVNTSDIIAGYFNEDGEQDQQQSTDNNTSKAGADKIDNDKVKENIKVKVDNGENLSDIKNKISNYFRVCGDFLGAKMSVSIEAYNDYKRILKWHVNQFSDSGKKDNKGSDEGPIDIEGAANNNEK